MLVFNPVFIQLMTIIMMGSVFSSTVVNIRCDFECLKNAIGKGDHETIRLCVQNTASEKNTEYILTQIMRQNLAISSALMESVSKNQTRISEILLEAGAYVFQSDQVCGLYLIVVIFSRGS